MKATSELLVMKLRSEAEEMYLSKECREPAIQGAVKAILMQSLEENKISSTEYQEALDILKRYELN